MSSKKLVLVSLGFIWINTTIQAEEWGRVRCLRECTDRSCSDPVKMEACQNNCAHNPDTLEACNAAKPSVPSQQTPRAGLRKLPTLNVPKQQENTPSPKSLPPVPEQPQPKLEIVDQLQPKPKETIPEQVPEQQFNLPTESIPPVVEQAQPESGEVTTEMQNKPTRPTERVPQKQSASTYTAAEVNSLLKGLLDDQIKEVTTGCKSAIGKIEGGLKMVSAENTKVEISNERDQVVTIDLSETGDGFIEIFKKEQEDAESWVKSFNISQNLSEKDLKTYGIDRDKDDFDPRKKLSLKVLKKIYQKSQEKSLLAAQDCKVKSAQFQNWLEIYLAKNKKKSSFFSWGSGK